MRLASMHIGRNLRAREAARRRLETMMMSGPLRRGAFAAILCGIALALGRPCQAEPTDEGDAAALQADVKKGFRDQVTPFVKAYCVTCYGNRKSKAGVNFE